MSKWRIILVAVFAAAPPLFLMGYGSYQLWINGLSFYVWWPMAGSLALAYVLGWYWQKKQKLLRIDFTPELHWTDRDKEAWRIVEQRAKAADKLPSDKLVQFTFYAEVAQEMGLELARHYHPHAKDPLSALTLPEILAVVELASHDLAEMVDKYLPGGHLMTIKDWMNAKKASDYYTTASNIYWIVSALFSPVNTAMRYLASKGGVSRPWGMLQQNLVLWFYTAFLQRMGTYLIDLNSGRLRVGAQRYRELVEKSLVAEQLLEASAGHDIAGKQAPHPAPSATTIGLIGQVKAGKSSLVNAILGKQLARTNVLPETRQVAHYELKLEGTPAGLDILDTIGYGHSGPREDQLPATHEAAQKSDVLLLVLHGRTAARQPDLLMLQALRKWFDSRPDLKMPRVIAVLTHIDLLAPAMEWQPPYDWQKPLRVKEQQTAAAVSAVREQLGDYLAGVVPVCVAEGRVYGVEEWLMPALVRLLDEARAVNMLRCLRAEADAGKVRKVFEQLLAAGKELAMVLWEVGGKR